ncbi:MAG TPA: V-type ATP synthase subunit B [Treponema sp.]|mgnify:FL=1|jgi:V/A-type H+-transporting ATPase subunit B|nr:V-type ATP synthase subunit B [Treponema sp.]HON13023.1 V-type ATP synthase subunit B [Treponema sp.]HPC71612.1 V-type ATP synthase subunit B [Treponema sp.]HRS03600.1 V-type ATP synthase subunit B [Treponema sp.]HRU28322.1 V-type ATP synthase subunit B [Treponema sp.]
MRGIEYKGLERIEGPVVITKRSKGVGFGEVVAVYGRDQGRRLGRVVDLSEDWAAIQIFGSSTGLSADDSRLEFLDRPMELRVGPGLLGRVFDGLGRPIDGFGEIFSSDQRDINGLPINPYARVYPRDFIQTGISAIDGMNTLIRGQKLPIFSGNGLPHNRLAAQIVRQSKIRSANESFVVVFAAMGVKYDVARFFLDDFERTGVLANVVVFMSLADAPSIERLITPRCALTAAEYLAYEQNMHVLVVMTDMTNYCEALREVSSIRGEVPSRKGYPGYLYSDLASLYERAGKIQGASGSITQIPILTMPNDDISHPIPDLSGYITEGQIVLDRELTQRGVYPPVAGLPSLSRLMKDGIGPGMTREDHKDVASQLFAAYSRVKSVRNLASIIGEEELSALDKHYLAFGERFEQDFLTQGEYEDRSIETTLDLGWKLLSKLPKEELLRIKEDLIHKYLDPIFAESPSSQEDLDDEDPDISRMRSAGHQGR